jgi:hypothetical protein
MAVLNLQRRSTRVIVAIVIGLLALFSLISFLLDTDEPRQASVDPAYDYAPYLMRFSAH